MRMQLIQAACRFGWLTLGEAMSQKVQDGFQQEAEFLAEARPLEMGSSDLAYYTFCGMKNAGFPMDTLNGRYVRTDLDEDQVKYNREIYLGARKMMGG